TGVRHVCPQARIMPRILTADSGACRPNVSRSGVQRQESDSASAQLRRYLTALEAIHECEDLGHGSVQVDRDRTTYAHTAGKSTRQWDILDDGDLMLFGELPDV